MDKKPIVILYSETLSSYLLYSEFIKKYPDLIKCIIRFPVIPRHRKERFFEVSPIVKRIFKRASWAFLVFNFLTISFYNCFAFLFRNRLSDLAEKNNIKVLRYKMIDETFLYRIKSLEPGWIFNNTACILKNNLLTIPGQGTLNYHSAPLPQYRGAGNYFWMLFDGQESAHGTLHYVIEKLDAGDIIMQGEDIAIREMMSIFDLWYKIRLGAFPSFSSVVKFIKNGERIPAEKQDERRAALRSFPGSEIWIRIKSSGHQLMNLENIIKLVKIGISGEIIRD